MEIVITYRQMVVWLAICINLAIMYTQNHPELILFPYQNEILAMNTLSLYLYGIFMLIRRM
jgi:hypothetical protein